MASFTFLLAFKALPRLWWAAASLGSRAMALLQLAMASSTIPFCSRALPRAQWASACLGSWAMALLMQGLAEVVVGVGVPGVVGEDLAKAADGAVVLPPVIAQYGPEVVVSEGQSWVEGDGLTVAGDGLIHLPLAIQGIAEVGVSP